MSTSISRRELLLGAGAVAAGHLLPETVFAAEAAPSTGMEYRTAREQVAALANRQISALELMKEAQARIERLDPKINAVVVRDFERALDAAKAADEGLARGERRPLLGLPMTVKEAFNVAGLPTTWGIPPFKGWQPSEDAVAVARLKEAGAIIIGKTNVPLGLGDWQSYNDIYGTTNNPWDLSRTPGGSSGGGAAALAAGFVALELGSDIGGSLRAPAHYCGVYSHKPSWALLPSRGHTFPKATPSSHETDLAVIGPLARSAGDLALALDLLAGPDEPMSKAYRLSLPAARRDDLKSFRVLVLDNHPLEPTSREVCDPLDRLAQRLAKAGATVSQSSPLLPDMAEMTRVYIRLLAPILSGDGPPARLREIEKLAASLPSEANSLGATYLRAAVESHRDWRAADRTRVQMQRQWQELFKEWDVVLCPPMPTAAFPHDHSADIAARKIVVDGRPYPYGDQFAWPGVATLAGLPATTIPLARTAEGLPVGVQIVGPYLEDRTTIALAILIEREFGGFVAPPLKA